jgi:hypothetical protein
MLPLEPWVDPDDAVNVRELIVLRVTVTVATPLAKVGVAATCTVWLSLAVRVTLPAKPVTVFPKASWAVKVTVKLVPAITPAGALTANAVAAPAPTVVLPPLPWIDPEVAVKITLSAVFSVTVTVAVPLTKVTGPVTCTVCPSPAVKVTLPA